MDSGAALFVRLDTTSGSSSVDVHARLTELVPTVRKWMWRLLGPRPDFEDAVQDALVELARALPRFEGRSALTTYAHPIVLRTAYRYMGRRVEERAEPAALERVAGDDDPEHRAARRQELDRLHRVLERLPEKQRVAFVLCAVERLPHEEAAALEGISLETLRARLKRARAELARRLRADPELVASLRGDR
ncbi:MAG: sigma-70 family RNA polymerase sigma factor [Sandaracinaceae bacterium]|nr:sigma-70 family RNA polymerase sigma factor [Sandaracinaceae bacterium]